MHRPLGYRAILLEGIRIDPARFKQILYNYLSNAIKFTPNDGHVTVTIKAEGKDAFRLAVQDTGIGISPEDRDRLFIEFQQLPNHPSNSSQQGTRLGLALTKRLVEAQGGTIDVQSTPGHGSTFFAVLPRATRNDDP